MNIASLILAAGKGTRMKSKLPKVLHKVGGKAMVERVLETVQSIGTNRDVVIVGFGGDAVQNYLGERAEFVRQEEQNGTGHAVKIVAAAPEFLCSSKSASKLSFVTRGVSPHNNKIVPS